MGLAILARLFCCAKRFAFGSTGGASVGCAGGGCAIAGAQARAPAPLVAKRFLLLGESIGARVATTKFFVRGDFLRDAWLRCGARGD